MPVVFSSCTQEPGTENNNETTVAMDSITLALNEWRQWAESSDDGLWENEDHVLLNHLRTYAGEESESYFNPGAIAYVDDKIIISDQGHEALLCLDASSGQEIWKCGESGEGPGYFSRIGHISVSDSTVYIGNMHNNRIDVYSINGEYEDYIGIQHPYDMTIIGDTLLAVISLAESNLITLIDLRSREITKSFGEWHTNLDANIVHSNRNLFTCSLGDSLLAVASFYESNIHIYNIYTEQLVSEFYRKIPFTIEFNSPGLLRIHIADICAYNDSILCVVLPPVSNDREPLSSMENIAEIAICDRYSIAGEYLDSFVIPENTLEIEIDGSHLLISNPLEFTVSSYCIL